MDTPRMKGWFTLYDLGNSRFLSSISNAALSLTRRWSSDSDGLPSVLNRVFIAGYSISRGQFSRKLFSLDFNFAMFWKSRKLKWVAIRYGRSCRLSYFFFCETVFKARCFRVRTLRANNQFFFIFLPQTNKGTQVSWSLSRKFHLS